MTSQQFALDLAKVLGERSRVSDTSSVPCWTLTLDTFEHRGRADTDPHTKYQLEKAVCNLVKQNNVDPTQVRYEVSRGHLLVQLRPDVDPKHSLATRSVWKRLKDS